MWSTKRLVKDELAPIDPLVLTCFLQFHRSSGSLGFQHKKLKSWAQSAHKTFKDSVTDLIAGATALTQLLT